MINRGLRLFLCAALLTPAVPVRAQEEAGAYDDAGDLTPVGYCAGRELSAADLTTTAGGIEAGETEAGMEDAATPQKKTPTKPMSLGERQSTLARVARVVEFFRSPGADAVLKKTFSHVVPPAQLKFFSSRRRVLSSMYRTLAVIDYTYAVKQPGVCKVGAKARHEMLYAKDGLFVDPKTGKFSPWLERLTGKKGGSVATQASYEESGSEEAADEASEEAGASFQDNYQRVLDYQLKLTRRIDATKDPKEKAGFMCTRARGYRVLALAALRQKPLDKTVKASTDLEASEESVQASADTEAGAEQPTAAGAEIDAGDAVTEAGWTQPTSRPTLTANALYKKTASAVVAIRSTAKAGGGMFGTGSVFTAFGNGQILTNAHVVWNKAAGKPYDLVTVFFKPVKVTGDRTQDLQNGIPAKIMKLDRTKDLALLALTSRPANLQAIELGDDTKVEIGDPVFAIGHPEQGGLWTLTQGVVSAVKANLGGVKGKDAFQTDASINRGNSGGPLLDATGRQIGINSLIARRADDGLAITSVNFSLKMGFVNNWLNGPDGIVAGEEAGDGENVAEEIGDEAGDGSILTVARPYSLDEVSDGESVQAGDDLAAAADETPVSDEASAVESAAPDDAAAPEAKILTPTHPYDANALMQQQMKEMDDQGKEMSREIERRMAGATAAATPAGSSAAETEIVYNDAGATAPEAAGDGQEAGDLTESGAIARPLPPAAVFRAPPVRQVAPPPVAPRVVTPAPIRPSITTIPPKPVQPQGGRPGPQAPKPAINKPGPLIGGPSTTYHPPIKPIVPGGCINQGGGITVPLIAMKGDKDKGKGGDKGKPKPQNVTANGQPTNEYGQKLGPSGKPMIHNVDKDNKKGAKDAARNNGSGAPIQHPNPTEGDPHFHSTDSDGNKKQDGVHYNYPP